MKIVFRTDASLQIGAGHVMRCLALAEALKIGGGRCQFICREHPGNLISLIQKRGFSVSILPTATAVSASDKEHVEQVSNYEGWLGVDWETDSAQTIGSFDKTRADWLIVDHYAISSSWEKKLRPMCKNLMVIDDLADRTHDCDLLLDQNLGRNVGEYAPLVPEACTLLVGPRYALLRPEFATLREESLRRRTIPQLRHLLISMGGVDQNNATGSVLNTLLDLPLPPSLRITVVMGRHAPWLERVQLLTKQLSVPAKVVVNAKNMAVIMASSDLAIGAAGMSAWERCCLGLPTLIVVLAENQRSGSKALEQSGSVRLLGSVKDIPRSLRSIFHSTITSDSLRLLSQKSCLVTDGQGAIRVKDALNDFNT